ncbi:MAG TPA: hypothetical protein [Caudoviricetes sp.]|nr:MAG TPA: hypothetical protein [Caudoviricetes sp.]
MVEIGGPSNICSSLRNLLLAVCHLPPGKNWKPGEWFRVFHTLTR